MFDDILDFEDELGITLPFERHNPAPALEGYDVLEVNELGSPIARHILNPRDLVTINDYYELEPLGQFSIGGSGKVSLGGKISSKGSSSGGVSIGGKSSGSGRASVSTRPSGTGTISPFRAILERRQKEALKAQERAKSRVGAQTQLNTRIGLVPENQRSRVSLPVARRPTSSVRQDVVSTIKRQKEPTPNKPPVPRETSPQRREIVSQIMEQQRAPISPTTTVPVRVIPEPMPQIIAVPRLQSAAVTCGCKPELMSIRALLEKADLQRIATNEHAILRNTTQFRRKALRDLVDIREKLGRAPQRGEVLRVLASCGIKSK